MNARYQQIDPEEFLDDFDDNAFADNDSLYDEDDQQPPAQQQQQQQQQHKPHKENAVDIQQKQHHSHHQHLKQTIMDNEVDIDDIDYEVHSINVLKHQQHKPDIQHHVNNNHNGLESNRTSRNGVHHHHHHHLPPSQDDIDNLLDRKFVEEHQMPQSVPRLNRPGSASRLQTSRQIPTVPLMRPMSARPAADPSNGSLSYRRPSSASRQTSLLRQKLALPQRISSIPPPDQFPIASMLSTNL
jgi:hypothetical protein